MRANMTVVVVVLLLCARLHAQERRLIPPEDQRALKNATSTTMAVEIVRIRKATDAPVSWRLNPDLTNFYNPAGMSPAQITTYEAAQRAAAFTATSRQKDILATCALVVRAKGLAAWTAMTIPQKTTATLAECDAWVIIRDFIETTVP